MLLMCRLKKFFCWRGVMATRDLRSYFTSKKKEEKIPEKNSRISQSKGKFHGCWYIDCKCSTGKLVKRKRRQSSLYNKYSTSKASRVEEEVEKYAYSNGTQAIVIMIFFYIHLSTVGNVSSITRKKIFYHRSSINVGDLISWEMTCYKDKGSGNWSCDFKKDGCFYR